MTCRTCKLNFPREDIDHDGVDCWRCLDAKREIERTVFDPLESTLCFMRKKQDGRLNQRSIPIMGDPGSYKRKRPLRG